MRRADSAIQKSHMPPRNAVDKRKTRAWSRLFCLAETPGEVRSDVELIMPYGASNMTFSRICRRGLSTVLKSLSASPRVDVRRTFPWGTLRYGSRERTFDFEAVRVDDLLIN